MVIIIPNFAVNRYVRVSMEHDLITILSLLVAKTRKIIKSPLKHGTMHSYYVYKLIATYEYKAESATYVLPIPTVRS